MGTLDTLQMFLMKVTQPLLLFISLLLITQLLYTNLPLCTTQLLFTSQPLFISLSITPRQYTKQSLYTTDKPQWNVNNYLLVFNYYLLIFCNDPKYFCNC